MGQIVLVTGMSGAGRTTALKALEDLGFEAVDNLPVTLLGSLIRPGDRLERDLAIGIDCRTRAFDPPDLIGQIAAARRGEGLDPQLLFLDCEDEILRRRFNETRRRHPLALDRPVTDGIAHERQVMAGLRAACRSGHRYLPAVARRPAPADRGPFHHRHERRLTVSVLSFAYRGGLPREADVVFDVRFLANPHYVDELRPKHGQDPAVRAYVEADPGYGLLLERLEELLLPLLPSYQREGRSYLTIAFGCTGGRHRSIVVAEAFAARLRERAGRSS